MPRSRNQSPGRRQALAGLLACMLLTPGAAMALGTADAVRGLIVSLQTSPGAEPARVNAAHAERFSAVAGRRLALGRALGGDARLLRFSDWVGHDEAREIAARLSAREDVRYAAPDYWRRPSAVPNDPRFGEQWYLQDAAAERGSANLPGAWDITTGSAEVVIAVIDTGILPTHADFDRLLPGYDFVANDPDISIDFENDATAGRDADPTDPGDAVTANECENGNDAADSTWHGTLVAGIVGAASNNAFGIAGVDQQARILPVRALGKCGGLDSDIIDAARWAAGLSVPGVPANANRARVLNLSLGGFGECTAPYQAAFDEMERNGVVVVVAAGNEGQNLDQVAVAPAVCDGAFAIAATSRQGAETDYTNYGGKIDLAAAGGTQSNTSQGLLSASDSGTGVAANDDAFQAAIGTSFAAPQVSGVVGLMLALSPSLTPVQVRQTILINARAFPSGTTDGFADCTTARCGAGLLDATATLTAVQAGNIPGFFAGGRKVELLGDASDGSGLALGPWVLLLAAACLLRRLKGRRACARRL